MSKWTKAKDALPTMQMLCKVKLDSGEVRDDVYMLDYECWFEADSSRSSGKVVKWRYKRPKIVVSAPVMITINNQVNNEDEEDSTRL